MICTVWTIDSVPRFFSSVNCRSVVHQALDKKDKYRAGKFLCTADRIVVHRATSYHTCAIITCGLYVFYPIFEVNFFVFKDSFLENSVLMVSIQERFLIKSRL